MNLPHSITCEYAKVYDLSKSRVPTLGKDYGLNKQLLTIDEQTRSSKRYLQTEVYKCLDVTVSGEWGYLKSNDFSECIELLKKVGWSDEHLENYRSRGPIEAVTYTNINQPTISLLWPGILTYGHWILDTIPRLYQLRLLGLDLSSCVVLLPEHPPHYMKEILSAFDIRSYAEVSHSRHALCAELYVPSHTRTPIILPEELYLSSYKFVNDRLRARTLFPINISDQQFYVKHAPQTSKDIDNRELSNESEVLTYVKSLGYKEYNPSKAPIVEQFTTFSTASAICGVDSSALHNIVFCQSLRALLVFCPPWRTNYNHVALGSLLEATTTMLLGNTVGTPQRGLFKIAVSL